MLKCVYNFYSCSLNDSAVLSTSVTSHTISSAVKNDYSQPETQAKLRELGIPGEVKYVVEIDKTGGRKPFVVRHVSLFILEIDLTLMIRFLRLIIV